MAVAARLTAPVVLDGFAARFPTGYAWLYPLVFQYFPEPVGV